MADKKRLIYVDEAIEEIRERVHEGRIVCSADVYRAIYEQPTVDAVELPCRIGDTVWAIRSFHGIKSPQKGIVGDMFVTRDMELVIVVKYVARGKWGETVFATCEDAANAIARMRKDR